MKAKNLFIIQDEEDLSGLLSCSLTKEGFKTHCFNDCYEAFDTLQLQRPDCILVDLMLPGVNGYDFCHMVKNNNKCSNIPVIVVSSRCHEHDIINAFNFGVDDYVTKPFNMKILAARVNCAIRKSCIDRLNKSAIAIKDLCICADTFEVRIKNKKISLTSSEFRLLYFLVCNVNRVYTRNQLLEEIKGDDAIVNDRSIDVMLARLRKKIGSYGKNIETIYGMGYRFNNAA
ncbi:MAG: response regulator transcription factor [bacterium]